MNPEISNLLAQGYSLAEAKAWLEACERIPERITCVVTPNGYVYSDNIPRPDMQIDFSGPCAMTSDGMPCIVLTLSAYKKYEPTEWDEDSVNEARHNLFLELAERNRQFRAERYEIGELELKIFLNSPPEMWDALNAAKTALERGNEFEIKSALENLRAAVNGPTAELVQLPLNDGQQAEQDSITAQMFNAVANHEEFTAPPLPKPVYAELATKEECHQQWNQDILDRANNKWRRGMFTCLCKDPMCPYLYGYGKKNYTLERSPEFFVFCEEAGNQMRELSDAANKAGGKL